METSSKRYFGDRRMIPRSYIQEWAKTVPWQEPRQVEQDLIITNALLKLYKHPVLKLSLAFRGGTALNKLFFNPPTRYSEDIDLVQTTSEPIGGTMDAIRETGQLKVVLNKKLVPIKNIFKSVSPSARSLLSPLVSKDVTSNSKPNQFILSKKYPILILAPL